MKSILKKVKQSLLFVLSGFAWLIKGIWIIVRDNFTSS